MALTAPIQERRQFPRSDAEPFAINLLRPEGPLAAGYVNWSEGGMCLRVQETLEVRSMVRLQVSSGRARPVECAGRVAWVMQRMDLRGIPPFLFDVGIQFINPPLLLRQWMAQRAGALAPAESNGPAREKLEPSTIRGRRFIPRLRRETAHASPWHLVVSVDDLPCFSGHYASQRAATAAWTAFRRQQAKSTRPAKK